MDGGHYAWIVANGVRAGGHYPIIDGNVIGGDGSGQGTVLTGNVRSLEVSTSFPCGFSDDFEKQGIKTGTLSVERLDADGVAGTLTVNLPSGATATASFAGSYCAKPRAPTTIGCDT